MAKHPVQLFVSRLSFYTTNEKLRALFLPFGELKETRLLIDPRTQRPKGYGFVTFESETDAHSALKALNGKIIDGRIIFVEAAKTTRPGEN
ncbi:hypothetical protein DM860_008059 [Cuscuta australis]|uniref:RRM domain-containing protein n=1 Tax=Cuscuta australis TaxID=267555 RepID=A0A328D6E9_9ASTE|nr:hypothetical protein DM860_008059 [Cuscuta australis]